MLFRDRVYGIENEYGRTLKRIDEEMDPYYYPVVQIFLRTIDCSVMPPLISRPRVWHSNGSCTYVDTGDHPEHATAECRLVRDVVAHNKAGELLIAKIFALARERSFDVRLFKNNFGYNELLEREHSFGCHENYLAPVFNVENPAHIQRIVPFLLSRQIIDGVGLWEGGAYHYSPRAYAIDHESASGTTSQRGIVCMKKSYETGTIPRLHLILGDSNILECAIFLKIGMTSLVLSLIEEDKAPEITCMDSVRSLHRVSREGALADVVWMKNNEFISAHEIQARYLEAVLRELSGGRFESEETEAELKEIARLWEQALNAVYAHDIKWMLGHLDWATKQYLAEYYLKKNAVTNESDRFSVCRDFDIAYHAVSDRTLQEKMNARWADRRIVTDAQIADACVHAPDTRARMREDFVRKVFAENLALRTRIDWAVLGDLENMDNIFYMNNPLECHAPDWDLFLERFAELCRKSPKSSHNPPIVY